MVPLSGNKKSAAGRKPRTEGIPRTGLIRARVLPRTEEIFLKAAGSSEGIPPLLDEIAKILGNLKDA
jgi:hypothetical protein